MGKFQPGLKLNVRAGTVVFLYLLLYIGVLRMRLRIFSPVSANWAENRGRGEAHITKIAG